MISALYAVLATALVIWLAFSVIKIRRVERVSVGDGGIKHLKAAMAAHSNAVEFIPIALLLMFALEFNHASVWWIHLLGIALLAGRYIHAKALLGDNLPQRVLGMKITFGMLATAMALNLLYLPYAKFFGG